MLIDLVRYPLVLIPDECRSSIVVRTCTTKAVSGVVSGEDPHKRGTIKGRNLVALQPTASTEYGSRSYHETRLPLHRDVAHSEAVSKIALIYEAASAAKDTLTDTNMIWRVQISVVRKDSGLWGVTIVDLVREVPLVSVATKSLDDTASWNEPVPLARAAKLKIMAAEPTFWDRIANDD